MKRRHGQTEQADEMQPPLPKRPRTEAEPEEQETIQPAMIENVLQQLPETDYLYQQNVHLRAVERERMMQKNRAMKE